MPTPASGPISTSSASSVAQPTTRCPPVSRTRRPCSAPRGPAEGAEVDDRIGAATALASTTAVLAVEERPAWWRAAPRQVAIAAVAGVMLLSGVAAAATHGLSSHPAGPVTSNGARRCDAHRRRRARGRPPSTSIDDSTSVPDSEPPSSTLLPSTTVASGDHGVGPLAIGPALRGLCTAFADRTVPPGSSVAYRNLAEAAAAAGEAIQELCAGVFPSDGKAQGNGNGEAAAGSHDDADHSRRRPARKGEG